MRFADSTMKMKTLEKTRRPWFKVRANFCLWRRGSGCFVYVSLFLFLCGLLSLGLCFCLWSTKGLLLPPFWM